MKGKRVNFKAWTLPTDSKTEEVLVWCLENDQVDRLLVTTRLQKGSGDRILSKPEVAESVEMLFGKDILTRKAASVWPGTRLIGHNGLSWTIRFTENLIAPMAAVAEQLRNSTRFHTPPLSGGPLPVPHRKFAFLH